MNKPAKLLTVLISSWLLSVCGTVLKTIDFNNFPVGKHDAHDSIGGTLWFDKNQDTQSFIEEDGTTGNRYWRTKFPKRCRFHACGAQLLTQQPLLKDREELWFSQRIRVDNNFDFVHGGILPGICGGACDTTCSNEPGDNKGWSVRLQFDGSGHMNVNIFDMIRKKDVCGRYPNLRHNGSRIKIQKGMWHFVEMRVKLNSSNNPPNGILQVYVDGKQGLSISTLKWRNNLNANPIEVFYANMYLYNGGKFLEHDSNVSFDDFTFSTTRLSSTTPKPTTSPTLFPTKLPTASPTTVDELTTTPPTEPSATGSPATDSPTSAESNGSNTSASGGIDDATIAAIGSFMFVMGIAVFGISRRYRNDRYPVPSPLTGNSPPGLRPSVARRVQSIFKSSSSRNDGLALATPVGIGGKKPSKVKLIASGSSKRMNASFSSVNPKFRADTIGPTFSAASSDSAWEMVGNPAEVFEDQLDDK